MFFVYIIQSLKTKKYYTGFTSDIDQRMMHHNSGANKSTRKQGPWELIYQEMFPDKKSAWMREKQIKSYKSGEAFKKLVKHGEVA